MRLVYELCSILRDAHRPKVLESVVAFGRGNAFNMESMDGRKKREKINNGVHGREEKTKQINNSSGRMMMCTPRAPHFNVGDETYRHASVQYFLDADVPR